MTNMTKSAISLTKLQAEAPGLVEHAEAAAYSLVKKGLDGHRAAIYLILDHSGSMQPHYNSGAVQRLTDQALGLSVNLDDDGKVPTVFFGDHASAPIEVDLSSYRGVIGRSHPSVPWGFTNYADAIDDIVGLHLKSGATAPGLVIFQTDGNPYTRFGDAKKAAVKALKDASQYPLFFSFVGFGEEMDFLRRLDDLRVGLGGRRVDNASLFETGYDPFQVTDAQLYDGIMHEYPAWLAAARREGIIR